jgi:hypothetical protein
VLQPIAAIDVVTLARPVAEGTEECQAEYDPATLERRQPVEMAARAAASNAHGLAKQQDASQPPQEACRCSSRSD